MSIRQVDTRVRRAVVFTPMESRRQVLVDAAVCAERLGYEAIVVPEGWSVDSSVVLAEVAVRTDRIRLVAGVQSIWGRSAATLAMTAATLDDLSGGRFTLGLGASTALLAERFHDVEFDAPAARLETVVTQVRSLLAGERLALTNGGTGLRLGQPARPDVPLWVAGLGPQAVRIATNFSDGWFPMMVPKDAIDSRRRTACQTTANDCDFVTGPIVAVDDAPEAARSAAEQLAGWYLTGMGSFYGDIAASSGFADEVAALRDANPKPSPGRMIWPTEANALLSQLAVFGDRASVAEQLRDWDTIADVVAVVVGPAPMDEIVAAIEASAPAD